MVTLTSSGGPELVGVNYTFTCQILGGSTAPTYRWFKEGNVISGETSSTLFISRLTLSDSGDYTCEGTRNAMSATSIATTLAVTSE